ncbi:hypothetical protein ACP70R_002875 [Stipagrostis hirtigluma subsp. patula]
MPPKNHGHAKGTTAKEPKVAVSSKPSSEFELNMSNLATIYKDLMVAIEAELETLLKLEAPSNSKDVNQFVKPYGKLYTALSGSFLIRM